MTFTQTSISLGEGIGLLYFGMNTQEVEQLLGKPDEVETLDDDDDEIGGTTWHYDNLGLSCSFEEGDDLTLTSLSATDNKYTLRGKSLIGITYDDFEEIVEELDLGRMEYDNITEGDGPKQVVLEFNDESISFWFDDNILTEIQWGPHWDDQGDLWVRGDSESKINDKILDYDEEYGD